MAEALAWRAKTLGIRCRGIVPDTAPRTKLHAIKRYGAEIVQTSFDQVWNVVVNHRYPALEDSIFIHPFADPRMIAGNGTIGLEILEDHPGVESVIIPFGGGGLSTGGRAAIRSRRDHVPGYVSQR